MAWYFIVTISQVDQFNESFRLFNKWVRVFLSQHCAVISESDICFIWIRHMFYLSQTYVLSKSDMFYLSQKFWNYDSKVKLFLKQGISRQLGRGWTQLYDLNARIQQLTWSLIFYEKYSTNQLYLWFWPPRIVNSSLCMR
jgi:hypothetical protein